MPAIANGLSVHRCNAVDFIFRRKVNLGNRNLKRILRRCKDVSTVVLDKQDRSRHKATDDSLEHRTVSRVPDYSNTIGLLVIVEFSILTIVFTIVFGAASLRTSDPSH